MRQMEVDQLLALLDNGSAGPLIDVRAPAEYSAGHIAGAANIPLFDDDERAEVGTLYKLRGARAAKLRGLEFVGPRMADLARAGMEAAHQGRIMLHCWRGGERSQSVAWLWEGIGLEVTLLSGGYKAFRRYSHALFGLIRKINILSGKTGSAKTATLHELKSLGEQVIDLEALAAHRGSSFGAIGSDRFVTQEQFENDLALALAACDPTRPLWLEDESIRIGHCHIPQQLWEQMRAAPLFMIELPLEERIARLVLDYGEADSEELMVATERLRKRLGGVATDIALHAIRSGDLSGCARILLNYYDTTYSYTIEKHGNQIVDRIDIESGRIRDTSPHSFAEALIESARHSL